MGSDVELVSSSNGSVVSKHIRRTAEVCINIKSFGVCFAELMYKFLLSMCYKLIIALICQDDFLPQNGITALSLAKSRGHLSVVELLHTASTQPKKMVHVLHCILTYKFPSSLHHLYEEVQSCLC